MTLREQEMTEEIKNRITVPMYFEKIIVPNMQFYYEGEVVDLEVYPVCKCPLHNEDTGSFRYFDYSNSFYCYGCTIGGDVINLHREFMKASQNETLSFREAIVFLYKFFIEGNETALINKNIRKEQSEKRLSTNVELVRFNNKLEWLEKYLLETNGLNVMQKNVAFHRIDLFEMLVTKNKMNATEGREALDKLEKSLRSVDNSNKIRYIHKTKVEITNE